MKINDLFINNFRGISTLDVELNGKSTVFFGVNGMGKSTIIKAIDLVFHREIQRAIQQQFKQNVTIGVEDIKAYQSTATVTANIKFDDGGNCGIGIKLRREKKKHKFFYLNSHFSHMFRAKYVENDESNMPMYASYGVHRVVLDIPLRIRKNHEFDKVSAFEQSISKKIDFRTFFEWFRNQEDLENQIRNSDPLYRDRVLECVRTSVYKLLEGFSNLCVERNPLRMTIFKGKQKFSVEQLSEGEKCTLALFGDIARRIAMANPSLEEPQLGSGIVLIDEIELHLHPIWQRKIINVLRETFPNIQFIITTHSPQVLGEIDESMNIFEIISNDGNLSLNQINSLVGWNSNYILEHFMGAASLNESTQILVENIFELIESDKLQEAEVQIENFKNLTDSAHEVVVKANTLLRRKRLMNEAHK